MLPPALSEYAVEPVGVLMMRPSATAEVRCRPEMEIERCVRCGEAPRWRIISLSACRWGGDRVVPVGLEMDTRRRFRRRTRAVRVGPREAPRLDGQLPTVFKAGLLVLE